MTFTIYTKPAGCFGCTKTKQKFAEAGIAFQEVDVTANPAALSTSLKSSATPRSPSLSEER
jgi:glutaredoxin